MEIEWKKYAYTFLITAAIFATAILASNYFSQKKINEIKNIESRISVDMLASETQFSLLSELTCKDISSSFLSKELGELGDKLSYLEESRGKDDIEVVNLKKYYSLLEIKDYLMVSKIGEECPHKLVPILFFYSKDCSKCDEQGYVLTRMRQENDQLRIYSFDYDIDVSAVQTLASIYGIKEPMPALVINKKTYSELQYLNDIEKLIPEIKKGNNLNIVISPHFDDAMLSLGGSIGAFPGSSSIVTVFAGAPNPIQKDGYWDKISGFGDSGTAVRSRNKENINAAAVYNAETINLKYLDGEYRETKDDSSLEENITKDIEKTIRDRNKPDAIINVYGPAIFDQTIEHPDHLLVHNAFIKVAKNMASNTNVRFFIYEDYPYVEKNKEAGNKNVISILKSKHSDLNFNEIPIILSQKDLDNKKEAVSEYASQIKAFKTESKDIVLDAVNWDKTRCQNTIPRLSFCEVIYEVDNY